MKRQRIIVTGAGGYCGEHAIHHFAASSMEVIAVVRQSNQIAEAAERLSPAARIVACNLVHSKQVAALIKECKPNYVLHLAGLNAVKPSWSEPAAYLEANLMSTVHLLEGIRKAGLQETRMLTAGSMLRFTMGSQQEGPPTPLHPYSMSKTMQMLAAQCWSKLYNMKSLVAESSNLIGPGRSAGLCGLLARYTASCELALTLKEPLPGPFMLSSLTETRDYLDVRDAICAYEAILQNGAPGLIYAVASGVMRNLGEIANEFRQAAKCPIAIEAGENSCPSPEPINTEAVRSLGWQPRIPLRQSIDDALQYEREKGVRG